MDDPTRSWSRIAALFILAAATTFSGGAWGAPSLQQQPDSPRASARPEASSRIPLAGTLVLPPAWRELTPEKILIDGSSQETLEIRGFLRLERESPCRYRFHGAEVPAGHYRLALRDPPSSTQVEIAAGKGPIAWTIPEQVQLAVSVVDTEGELVPGARVSWRDSWFPTDRDFRAVGMMRPRQKLCPRTMKVDATTGDASLTVVPWIVCLEVEAPGYVRSWCALPLGGATHAEHHFRLSPAGYLVVSLQEWDPWADVTLVLTKPGQGERPDRHHLGLERFHEYAIPPGRYAVAASDPGLQSPVTSKPRDLRAHERIQVTLQRLAGQAPPPVVAATRGALLREYIHRVLNQYGIRDRMKVDVSRTISDGGGVPMAVAVRASFAEKESYLFDDLLRVVAAIEGGRDRVRIAEMDFGRRDSGSPAIFTPLMFEVVHTLPTSTDATEAPRPLPSLVKVVRDHQAVLERLREADLIPEGAINRLSVEIGPTSHIRWWTTARPKCDLATLRAAFADWPGFRGLTGREQELGEDALSAWHLHLEWSP